MTYTEKTFEEEGIYFMAQDFDVIKKRATFYNPEMKGNRDLTLLMVASFFGNKKIKMCDPMAASGIRELRMMNTYPDRFEKVVLGDISADAVENIEENVEENEIDDSVLEIKQKDARETMLEDFFDYIEVDPYGSPIPFMSIALQRIKHGGLIGITATDTASLCGVYPKTALRKYTVKSYQTLIYPEQGLRTLLSFCIREAARHDRVVTPVFSIVNKHYYKVFLHVEEKRTKAYKAVKDLSYIRWDKMTQNITVLDKEEENSIGPLYVGNLNSDEYLRKMKENLNLLNDSEEVSKMIDTLLDEPKDVLGYYNLHKLQRSFKVNGGKKFGQVIDELRDKGYRASRVQLDNFGIRTDASVEEVVEALK